MNVYMWSYKNMIFHKLATCISWAVFGGTIGDQHRQVSLYKGMYALSPRFFFYNMPSGKKKKGHKLNDLNQVVCCFVQMILICWGTMRISENYAEVLIQVSRYS
jgi:hypothetical protein